MRNPSGNNLTGTSITLTFGMHGWTILKTATPQGMAASSGMAVLDCDEEVSANTLFSLEVGGSLVGEALVKSAEEIVSGEIRGSIPCRSPKRSTGRDGGGEPVKSTDRCVGWGG